MAKPLIKPLIRALEAGSVVLLLLAVQSVAMPVAAYTAISAFSYVFLFVAVVTRFNRFLYVAIRDIPLLILILLPIFSVLWSENPDATLNEVKFAMRSTIFGIYIAMQYTSREQVYLLARTAGIGMVFSLIAGLAIPSYGIDVSKEGGRYWRGIYAHKQALGRMAGLASTVFLMLYFDRRISRWISLGGYGLILTLILLSQSKTSLIICVFSVCLLPLFKAAKQRKYKAIYFFVFFMLYSSLATLVAINLNTIVVDILGKNLEFNGRTPIWALSIERALERPWLGYGFNGFWTSDASDYVINNTWLALEEGARDHTIIYHAHNGFIDLFLQFGLLGCVIFLFSFLNLMGRIINLILLTKVSEHFWMIQFMGIFIIANMSEGSTIMSSDMLWIIYVSVALTSALESNRIRNQIYRVPQCEAGIPIQG